MYLLVKKGGEWEARFIVERDGKLEVTGNIAGQGPTPDDAIGNLELRADAICERFGYRPES